jgi:hypothetical protein
MISMIRPVEPRVISLPFCPFCAEYFWGRHSGVVVREKGSSDKHLRTPGRAGRVPRGTRAAAGHVLGLHLGLWLHL